MTTQCSPREISAERSTAARSRNQWGVMDNHRASRSQNLNRKSTNSTKTTRSGRETAQKRRLHNGDTLGELKYLSTTDELTQHEFQGRGEARGTRATTSPAHHVRCRFTKTSINAFALQKRPVERLKTRALWSKIVNIR